MRYRVFCTHGDESAVEMHRTSDEADARRAFDQQAAMWDGEDAEVDLLDMDARRFLASTSQGRARRQTEAA